MHFKGLTQGFGVLAARVAGRGIWDAARALQALVRCVVAAELAVL